MCTGLTYRADDLYYGRTLDYERSFSEAVAVVPQMEPKAATRLVLITANIHPLVVPVQPVDLEQMLPTLDRVAVPAMAVGRLPVE